MRKKRNNDHPDCHRDSRSHSQVRGATALDNVTLEVHANTITGLLGRNGAGKTTFMSLVTAQDQPSSGTVRINGREPFERAEIIEQMCFVRDNQRYPDDYKLKHAVRAAAIFYPNWDQATADRLIKAFRIPSKPVVKKFSRGQLSALGIVLGLASRSPITFFDEPYLGLDATARGIFYDELLRDYAEHPRTIILSTHLIDEMDRLLERVIVLEQGRVVHHEEVDALRGSAFQIAGRAAALQTFVAGRKVLSKRGIGGLATAVVGEKPLAEDRVAAEAVGLEITPVSLQDLVAAYGVGDTAAENDTAETAARGASRTERSAA
ncbi:ATP-binding cassette domain-containing protein [Leucobacter coleopterorum]|uniref:ATP-binding cassette domain-containing protein n=1 Tax=Leucobacter coleopterorum TaxID=2714933 RepID=UPI001FCB46A5|nr:ABC transporter ATP-binding protein [Leucobacter coleopterorum]